MPEFISNLATRAAEKRAYGFGPMGGYGMPYAGGGYYGYPMFGGGRFGGGMGMGGFGGYGMPYGGMGGRGMPYGGMGGHMSQWQGPYGSGYAGMNPMLLDPMRTGLDIQNIGAYGGLGPQLGFQQSALRQFGQQSPAWQQLSGQAGRLAERSGDDPYARIPTEDIRRQTGTEAAARSFGAQQTLEALRATKAKQLEDYYTRTKELQDLISTGQAGYMSSKRLEALKKGERPSWWWGLGGGATDAAAAHSAMQQQAQAAAAHQASLAAIKAQEDRLEQQLTTERGLQQHQLGTLGTQAEEQRGGQLGHARKFTDILGEAGKLGGRFQQGAANIGLGQAIDYNPRVTPPPAPRAPNFAAGKPGGSSSKTGIADLAFDAALSAFKKESGQPFVERPDVVAEKQPGDVPLAMSSRVDESGKAVPKVPNWKEKLDEKVRLQLQRRREAGRSPIAAVKTAEFLADETFLARTEADFNPAPTVPGDLSILAARVKTEK